MDNPIYTSKLREYTIVFEDENGNEISSDTYHYGDEIAAPEYSPDEMPDDGKEYEVTWDKEIGTVSEDATYKAVIKEVTSDSSSETEDAADNTEMTEETSEETASVEVSDNE